MVPEKLLNVPLPSHVYPGVGDPAMEYTHPEALPVVVPESMSSRQAVLPHAPLPPRLTAPYPTVLSGPYVEPTHVPLLQHENPEEQLLPDHDELLELELLELELLELELVELDLDVPNSLGITDRTRC